jgi:uncharacterized protein (DUF342 family)
LVRMTTMHKIAMQQLTKILTDKRNELRTRQNDRDLATNALDRANAQIKKIEEEIAEVQNTYELLRIAGGSLVGLRATPVLDDEEDDLVDF